MSAEEKAEKCLEELVEFKGGSKREPQVRLAKGLARHIDTGKPLIVEAPTGVGKALDINTPIATNNGWKNMGDLEVGDIVFDETGSTCQVIAAHPVRYDRPCYKLTFSDGSELVADAEHLWAVQTRELRCYKFEQKRQNKKMGSMKRLEHYQKVVHLQNDIQHEKMSFMMTFKELCSQLNISAKTLSEARSAVKSPKLSANESFDIRPILTYFQIKFDSTSGLSTIHPDFLVVDTSTIQENLYSDKYTNYSIELNQPLNLPKVDLPIDPYVLGAWLGDGNNHNGIITSYDDEIISEISKAGYEISTLSSSPRSFIIGEKIYKYPHSNYHFTYALTKQIKENGLFKNKHIPTNYQRASFDQRLSLLQGLMDTDGTINDKGQSEISLTNKRLALETNELVRSLGIKSTIRKAAAGITLKDSQGVTYRKNCGFKWTIFFKTTIPVFRLERKRIKLSTSVRENNKRVYIKSVERIESVPVRCIGVDSPNNLFLAGKTLIPTHNSFSAIAAARASGEKTLISTHTHGLQQQLQKDAEMLSEATGGFKISVLKGRSAYLCKLKENQIKQNLKDVPQNAEFQDSELDKVLAWGEETVEGDKSELDFPVSAETWKEVSVTAEQCAGKQCPFYKSCFAELAKTRAKESDITVLNHALVAQGMKQESFLDNAFPNIIVDEAHEFANVVGEAFGANITLGRLRWAAGKTRRISSVQTTTKFESAIEYLISYGKNVKEPLRHLEGHPINQKIVDLLSCVTQWIVYLDKSKGQKDYILKQSLFSLASELEIVSRGDTKNQTAWIEWSPDHFTLRSVLFNPGNQIKMNLIDQHHSSSFMSATMKTGNNFNAIAYRLGITSTDWVGAQIPHLFDYEKNGLIWYPANLKEPSDPGHRSQVAVISRHAIKAAQGRTLILCTSWRNVQEIGNALREKFRKDHIPVIMQKPGVNIKRLAEEFNNNPHSVLIGTMSLWTGMSFEGNTCISTIIDKIPFPSPGDPVIAARLEQIEENGGNGFNSVLVSEAALRIKQGIGRLLRTPTDQGVIINCDARMNPNSRFYKRYAKTIQDSLPPMPITYDTEVALNRLSEINQLAQ